MVVLLLCSECVVCMCAGAGKTTTFRMLTGDLSATSGHATIAGFDVATEFREVRRKSHYVTISLR